MGIFPRPGSNRKPFRGVSTSNSTALSRVRRNDENTAYCRHYCLMQQFCTALYYLSEEHFDIFDILVYSPYDLSRGYFADSDSWQACRSVYSQSTFQSLWFPFTCPPCYTIHFSFFPPAVFPFLLHRLLCVANGYHFRMTGSSMTQWDKC